MVRSRPKLIQGVGINDADYPVQPKVNGKQIVCPFYNRWHAMIKRCYSKKELEKRPTYEDKYVCTDWLTFSNFKAWMETQDWESKTLDKDILVSGNKVYSPEACAFVTAKLNTLLLCQASIRGNMPLGVSVHSQKKTQKNPFVVHVKGCVPRYQGIFETKEEAHRTWQRKKADVIESAVAEYITLKDFRQDVADALMSRATLLRYDANNGIETEVL